MGGLQLAFLQQFIALPRNIWSLSLTRRPGVGSASLKEVLTLRGLCAGVSINRGPRYRLPHTIIQTPKQGPLMFSKLLLGCWMGMASRANWSSLGIVPRKCVSATRATWLQPGIQRTAVFDVHPVLRWDKGDGGPCISPSA